MSGIVRDPGSGEVIDPDAPAVVVDLAVVDVQRSAPAYARLLGAAAPTADLCVGNSRIRLQHKDVDDAHRVLVTADDPDARVRLLRRRGLAFSPVPHASGEWYADGFPFGVSGTSDGPPNTDPGDITGIDHLVFSCVGRDRAVALFGATLGFDFRLDRRVVAGVRQLFFRVADLVIEVVVPDDVPGSAPLAAPEDAPVALWGVAWRSPDVHAARHRLISAGIEVSEIRDGRKPGTLIATVADDALATRTVIIGPRP
ncbi:MULTISPECIES: VOC family protein [unclassified Gordonia (in: high G+C Gram-positive bacteria)]